MLVVNNVETSYLIGLLTLLKYKINEMSMTTNTCGTANVQCVELTMMTICISLIHLNEKSLLNKYQLKCFKLYRHRHKLFSRINS